MRIPFSFYSKRINAIEKKNYILMLHLSIMLIILLQQDNATHIQ